MSEDEIKKRVAEAEQYAEEDKKRKESVETVNHAESIIYEMEKQLRENGDKLSEEDKTTVKAELEHLKSVKDSNDTEQLKKALEETSQKVYAIFGKIYQQTQGQPENNAPEAGTQNEDGSVNADFDVK